jgi:SAM-dependent methyltransferase
MTVQGRVAPFMKPSLSSGEMGEVHSPITGGPSVFLSSIRTRELCWSYRRYLKVDVSDYFRRIEWLQYRECVESGVRFFHPFCPGDDSFYAELSKHSWYYSQNKQEYRYAAGQLRDAHSVLDVGCGVGKFHDSIPHTTFTGLESCRSAAASGRTAGREIIPMRVEDHARQNANAYDAVTAFQVLEHVIDPIAFLRAMTVCARPNGLVIVSVPAEDGALGGSVNDFLNLPPHHMTRWNDRALHFVLTLAGLRGIELYHLPLDPEHECTATSQFLARILIGPSFPKKLIRVSFAERAFMALLRGVAERASRDIPPPFMWGHTVVATGVKCP